MPFSEFVVCFGEEEFSVLLTLREVVATPGGREGNGSNPDIPGIRVCFINAGLIIKINWDKGRYPRWWVYIRLIKAAGPGRESTQ